jgi:hypothetical protein
MSFTLILARVLWLWAFLLYVYAALVRRFYHLIRPSSVESYLRHVIRGMTLVCSTLAFIRLGLASIDTQTSRRDGEREKEPEKLVGVVWQACFLAWLMIYASVVMAR